jgi:hypothetical protein
VRAQQLFEILALVVAPPTDSRGFRESPAPIGSLLDVPEGVVAVEPGQPTSSRHTQQQGSTWAKDACGFGECLLL